MSWIDQEKLRWEQEEQEFLDSLNWIERLVDDNLHFALIFVNCMSFGFLIGFLIGLVL
jgi:hypothetical protein